MIFPLSCPLPYSYTSSPVNFASKIYPQMDLTFPCLHYCHSCPDQLGSKGPLRDLLTYSVQRLSLSPYTIKDFFDWHTAHHVVTVFLISFRKHRGISGEKLIWTEKCYQILFSQNFWLADEFDNLKILK
jgi:hypothetical protein